VNRPHVPPAPLPVDDDAPVVDRTTELAQARRLAERYRLEFVDMEQFRIDQELFRSIPADLMLRYGFVPHRRDDRALVIVVSDPSDLPMIDELSLLLGTPIKVTVGAPSAIESILKKSESSQRVLDEATESFQMQLLREEENGEDSLTVERLTSDISPIIRLVDSTIFTALQRPSTSASTGFAPSPARGAQRQTCARSSRAPSGWGRASTTFRTPTRSAACPRCTARPERPFASSGDSWRST